MTKWIVTDAGEGTALDWKRDGLSLTATLSTHAGASAIARIRYKSGERPWEILIGGEKVDARLTLELAKQEAEQRLHDIVSMWEHEPAPDSGAAAKPDVGLGEVVGDAVLPRDAMPEVSVYGAAVEAAALKLYETAILDGRPWESLREETKSNLRSDASTVVTAFLDNAAAQGWQLKPATITEAMNLAWHQTEPVGTDDDKCQAQIEWEAMFEAAPCPWDCAAEIT